ncbi:hypothetical protein [Kitasatospora sp. NPDC018619]|uniref:hypothetical protein n=1 Tax=unclassified Kitasatospora TaxID=2633591 RepID=UPI0037927CF1
MRPAAGASLTSRTSRGRPAYRLAEAAVRLGDVLAVVFFAARGFAAVFFVVVFLVARGFAVEFFGVRGFAAAVRSADGAAVPERRAGAAVPPSAVGASAWAALVPGRDWVSHTTAAPAAATGHSTTPAAPSRPAPA